MSIDEFIARLPKVELHCHLEGSVPATTFIELAQSHGIELATSDPEHVYDFDTFLGFLDLYYKVCAAIATPADVERAVYDSLAWGKQTGNLRYREMFFSPTNHPTISYPDFVAAAGSGIAAAEADHGVQCRLIAAINRRQSPQVALDLVETMIAHPSEYVIGLGIDDDEASGPPEMFVEAFAAAGKAGLRRTAHAGELGSAENVRTSIELLGCERIDHGYGMVNDPSVFSMVLDSGVHCTGAWFVNNFHAGVFTEGVDPATTGLARMISAGLPVSLGTDDPTMIPTDLNAEYASVAATLGLGEAGVLLLAHSAIDGAWIDEATRQRFAAELDAAAGPLAH